MRWRRGLIILLAPVLVLVLVAWLVTRLPPFGAAPEGERLRRVQASAQWSGGAFVNPQPLWLNLRDGLRDAVFAPANPDASPRDALVVPPTPRESLTALPESGLRITWFGHSSTLVEVDGARVLLDPFWGRRASPFGWIGPQRWYAPPLALEDLPPIDAVLISHDHYDHLDEFSIRRLSQRVTRFIVPLGIGAHLERWGVEPARITELDWWQSQPVGPLQITATPARHSSGRVTNASDQTLWAGYALVGPRHRVWFSGDSSYHDDLQRIGEQFGPFDVTLIEVGEYDANWPDAHFGPELAVQAHRQVRGRVMVPVHWGLLQLAPHTWTEPVERVLRHAQCLGETVRVLRPGEPAPSHALMRQGERWWPDLPVRTAAQAPVVGTVRGDPKERILLEPCR